jgi:putative ABC transport system substrate-binding protein
MRRQATLTRRAPSVSICRSLARPHRRGDRLQGYAIKRRQFITLTGAAAATAVLWPLPVQAQAPRQRRIGALLLGNADVESFRQEMRDELRKSDFIEGQNIIFDFRSAEGKLDILPKLAAELVALKVDVIVAVFTPCALAAQRATREIPIVVVTADAVGSGLVTSLARPGGNITGVSLMASELHGKCVELFRDMLPSLKRVAALSNAADPSWKPILEQIQLAGKATGIEIAPLAAVRDLAEVDAAFSTMKKEGAGGVVIQGSLATKAVADLALKHQLPAATVPRAFPEVGGLMSYGTAGPDSFRMAATFVIKILRGSQPADIPVEQPTKFELVINLKTAKALALTIPESLLLRANEVIE